MAAAQSDGGGPSHSIASAVAATYTATFGTQHQLTTGVSPAGGGVIAPGTSWVSAGVQAPVTATANAGYQFSGFTGALSGTTTPQYVTMNSPATVIANFTPNSNGPNLITNYKYDLFDNLSGVTMVRAAGTQTRTFVYNGKYLMSATNPRTEPSTTLTTSTAR